MEISEAMIRILVAIALGGLIGVEREYRDKSAGFRTLILISTGASLFTIFAFNIAANPAYGTDIDPTRIISYIISGIGFLGAGVIIKDGLNIRGLTTASTIWLAAALGMGAGAGFFALTTFATVVILFALIVLPYVERWIDSQQEFKIYQIAVTSNDVVDEVLGAFVEQGLTIYQYEKSKQEKSIVVQVKANGSPQNHYLLTNQLMDNKKVVSF